MPAARLIHSVGVNIHLEYTDGRYADAATVLRDLGYLGIARVRDGVPQPRAWLPRGQAIGAMQMLAGAGIRFDLIAPAGSNLQEDMEQVRALALHTPGSVVSVEGPNEINNWPVKAAGMTSEQAASAFQRALYGAVHAESALNGAPVLYFTGGSKIDLAAHPGLADDANTHPYPHNGVQPYAWLASDYSGAYTMPIGSYPWQITETGYYTDPASRDWGGVDDQTQARLLLNTLLDAASLGAEATYIYQLLDPYPYSDRRAAGADGHCGLFDYSGRPKPAAEAIRRLMTVLAGGGADGADGEPAVRVQGLPATGHALALSQGDGAVTIALWNEAPAWDAGSQKPLHAAAVEATVTVRGGEGAELVDPLSGKHTAVSRSSGGFRVAVPNSVILLVVRPAA